MALHSKKLHYINSNDKIAIIYDNIKNITIAGVADDLKQMHGIDVTFDKKTEEQAEKKVVKKIDEFGFVIFDES